MSDTSYTTKSEESCWFAIRTRHEFKASEALKLYCDDVFFPTESFVASGSKKRERALIPHVLFIKTTPEKAVALEKDSRNLQDALIPFWIYRYPKDNQIQVISQKYIDLLALLTSEKDSKCEIFRNEHFKVDQHVRIIGGVFKGYEGYVQRVRKNLHVLIKIEGICAVLLPFIHPGLLERIN